ncbi:MAG: MmcQ/YjbR family DNA-binding protein [Bacteroidales bacterium]|nr:MmcQ/YjbR family DNA-binding protein [Bacteroidales bacterium]
MNVEETRNYCLKKKAVTESFPFDDVTLVFKVMGKMFALLALDADPPSVNLKCDPDKAIELREHFSAVRPGYHMNKRLWNTLSLDGTVPDKLIRAWIDDSYRLVLEGLPKKDRAELMG